jgi:hypothetical protein
MAIILHSLATTVEQLCAKSADAPSLGWLRPQHCVFSGQAARNAEGILQLVGHGIYARQVRGLSDRAWIMIWVRRILCLACGHTMSLLPDWLHPWRWYAGTVIVEALFRHCILQQSAAAIGARFGRPAKATEWKNLRRWRRQLLVSPTLWGWLGPRLGVTEPAVSRIQGKTRLISLLAEGGCMFRSGMVTLQEIAGAVRRTLRDLIHDRKGGWPLRSFRPGFLRSRSSARLPLTLPTEEDSGPGPP